MRALGYGKKKAVEEPYEPKATYPCFDFFLLLIKA